jgi:four helix bundle protein
MWRRHSACALGRVTVMKNPSSEPVASPSVPYFPAERLLAYRVAREVLAEVARLSAGWHGRGALRAQALDAAESVVLNLGEGAAQPPGSGTKRRHYVIALGSADEVGAALDAARAQALSSPEELDAVRALAARSGALVAGLVRSATQRRR